MKIPGLDLALQALTGEAPACIARVSAAQWAEAARRAREAGGRIVALWGADRRDVDSTFAMCCALAVPDGLCVLELAVPEAAPVYPDLSGVFPAAERMQRAARDLLGIVPENAGDLRPWLRHGAWREGEYPLRRDFDVGAARDNSAEPYPFVHVEGDGVHEIAVGPIHAGVIEPGHFRFSVVGEKVLRLEERFGYTHKGVEKRFESFGIGDGYRLAGRLSGDSTVAYAWAYAQAAEGLLGVAAPPRARWLRALMNERERIANHLGDLGALGNDAGFGFALSQFMRLKEDWLRASDAAFGHRLMMDRVVPGGVERDVGSAQLAAMAVHACEIAAEVRALHRIFDEHSGAQDRFINAGRVSEEIAARLGLVGLAGRSSGQALDLRSDFPIEPYRQLGVKKVVYAAGDVAARVRARFEELGESLRLVRAMVEAIPAGETRVALPEARTAGLGVGWIEGWRGEVFVALEADAGGLIRRCHAHDPSWQNWPVVQYAAMDNIVADFPLINKSFNLGYSGPDG